MKLKNLYIAATSQHVGKTTSTLGLAASFKKAGINTGYCKPVGQKHVEIKDSVVDKDAVLFADLLKLDIEPGIHSPVILGKGSTSKYLDNPNAVDLIKDILDAREKLESTHSGIIFEGTGHPGVGSVADVSNATVAKLLDAQVVMVVEGGIGSTIDKLNMSLGLFRELDVPILGVIVNKVIPSKMEMVKKYVKIWLDKKGLRLLGVVPYDNTLGYPLIWTVAKTVKGTIEYNNEKGFNKVEKYLQDLWWTLSHLRSQETTYWLSVLGFWMRLFLELFLFLKRKDLKKALYVVSSLLVLSPLFQPA